MSETGNKDTAGVWDESKQSFAPAATGNTADTNTVRDPIDANAVLIVRVGLCVT